ncbi:alpha/beta fold hydrolase [Sphingobium sp.]|uniref:alpha/beta fold hydrolase n=1 Tax=Sphingobium sp. TaxID=1912891 RepID=UPI002612E627|nr:alpha/beta fold hydrolase [Sphingobium sp.]
MVAQSYDLGDVPLQYGGTLPGARICFETHGTLNAAKNNVVLFPTWCAGNHEGPRYVIGKGRALDPARYFIIVVDIFGNGMSSSPSNTPAPFDRMRFPHISLLDNVRLQRRLLHEYFGIDHIRLVVGRSMGAQQAFQWGAYYPDMVDAILALAGSARTSPHNYVFLAALKLALQSPVEWEGGDYAVNPEQSMRRFRLTADAWGFSQSFYREGLHLDMGFDSTQDYLDRPGPYPFGDTNDLLAQIRSWESADISDNARFNKDFQAALRAITARTIIMPSGTDLYFPPEDSAIEQAHMPNAELRVMPSIWGHRGGSPGSDAADIAFFETAIAELLEDA